MKEAVLSLTNSDKIRGNEFSVVDKHQHPGETSDERRHSAHFVTEFREEAIMAFEKWVKYAVARSERERHYGAPPTSADIQRGLAEFHDKDYRWIKFPPAK